ncbi:SixA phosphatase family protein [Pseudonocardia spinosispora]|uniref:SixA phosphatase family protein n=1 Tax=Pseudonocardia spinosispora TaxID=103441 RepID=UPI00040448F2|nr:histidine phosphatase family protein [Pseudonocardia spinosispora]
MIDEEDNALMRRRLVVLRHAKSSWPDGVADRDRPLAARGLREAPLAGRWLNEHVGAIDLVLCSPARRAAQTWAAVAEELDTVPEMRIEDRLYPGSPTDLTAAARRSPAEAATVLLIGHNPGLEDLVTRVSRVSCVLKTSSIAVLSGPGDWSAIAPGWATLDAQVTPRPDL